MAPVSLRFLGSGDAFASGGRFQACLYLDGAPEPLLLDCGATALIALKRAGIDPARIGWVALSHLHGDHFLGIPYLILDGQFSGRSMPLTIAGPPSAEERFKQAFEAIYPGSTTAVRDFETCFVTLEEAKPAELGPARITPFAVSHQSGAAAYGLRVEYGDKVIAYSGDTEWTDSLIDLAKGADLFVCECNYFDKRIPGHIDYRTLAAHRAQLDCARIVITHMSEEMLNRLEEAELEAASDGLVVTL